MLLTPHTPTMGSCYHGYSWQQLCQGTGSPPPTIFASVSCIVFPSSLLFLPFLSLHRVSEGAPRLHPDTHIPTHAHTHQSNSQRTIPASLSEVFYRGVDFTSCFPLSLIGLISVLYPRSVCAERAAERPHTQGCVSSLARPRVCVCMCVCFLTRF